MSNDENGNFGANLVSIRERLGINRTELRRLIVEQGHDMHMTTLRRIEAGEQEPRISDAIRIAHALGVSVELLLTPMGEYPALREVELARAQFARAVKDACMALSEWEKRGRELQKNILDARISGVPEKMLFDAANELGDADDVENLLLVWERATTGKADWLKLLTSKENSNNGSW